MAREVMTPVESQEPGRKRGVLAFFKELPVLIALALAIALVIKALLVQAFFIPSGSMQPTLEVHDRVLVNKLTYRFHEPERGDVVVFKEPHGDPCEARPGVVLPEECNRSPIQRGSDWFKELFGIPTGDFTNKDYIKRIVGLPGETFEMRRGVVYIDGERVDLPTTTDKGPQLDESDWDPVYIPEDHYWLLGDNRGNSQDSRTFGPVDREKVIGKAFVIVWPPTRLTGL